MIVVYSPIQSPRLNYTLSLIFHTILGCKYQLTHDKIFYETTNLPKLNYSTTPLNSGIFIQSHSLLQESNIRSLIPHAENLSDEFPVFFKSEIQDFLGFDILSTVFYVVTRYEEYNATNIDEHQRFKAENSLAYKYHFLHYPYINKIVAYFGDKLQKQYPQLIFNQRTFNFLSTIDIDNAFAYAHKGFVRNSLGFIKDACGFNFQKLQSRISSCINEKNDPYFTFQEINSISEATNTALHYFVLIGDYNTYDKNPHYQNKGFQQLLKSLSNSHSMGLHPSYASHQHFEKIGVEKKRLEHIIEKPITSARCHFLRLKLPDTYQFFNEIGITDDYTMIYASQVGFRTGLCTPHQWFDLQKNEATKLTIHPSTMMEGVLRDYLKLDSLTAYNSVEKLMTEVKKYGGEFISIFHNDSFIKQQAPWVDLYKKMLSTSKKAV